MAGELFKSVRPDFRRWRAHESPNFLDPKRLAVYFTKHSWPKTLGDKEYQHIVPEPWRKPGKGPSRFRGVFGLNSATTTAEIEKNAYLTARRIVRRWSRSQATYGNTLSRYQRFVTPRTVHHLVQRVG
jgi:hypothetical protein